MKHARVAQPTFPPYLTADEQRKNDDFEWALRDRALRKKYGGKVVAVHRRRVLGAGKNYQAGWAAAQRRRDRPAKMEVALGLVPCEAPTGCGEST